MYKLYVFLIVTSIFSESMAPDLAEVIQENVKLEEELNALKEECEDMQNYIAHMNAQVIISWSFDVISQVSGLSSAYIF